MHQMHIIIEGRLSRKAHSSHYKIEGSISHPTLSDQVMDVSLLLGMMDQIRVQE
jgi:hypothetical protein